MGERQRDDRPETDAAFRAALQAESNARQARADAERRAAQRVAEARLQAQVVARRADLRIERAHLRAAALEEAEIARIRLDGDAALQRALETGIDPAALRVAVRDLARQLTSDPEAVRDVPEEGQS